MLRRVFIDTRRADLGRAVSLAEDTPLNRAVDGGYDRCLDRWCLDRAMDRVSLSHRQVLVEIVYGYIPLARVAAGLDIPSGTVGSRPHDALRDQLSKVVDLPTARTVGCHGGAGPEQGGTLTASERPLAPGAVGAAA